MKAKAKESGGLTVSASAKTGEGLDDFEACLEVNAFDKVDWRSLSFFLTGAMLSKYISRSRFWCCRRILQVLVHVFHFLIFFSLFLEGGVVELYPYLRNSTAIGYVSLVDSNRCSVYFSFHRGRASID